MTTNINDLLVDKSVGTVGFEWIESLFRPCQAAQGQGKGLWRSPPVSRKNHLIRDILADPGAFCFGNREFLADIADCPKATVHNFQKTACC